MFLAQTSGNFGESIQITGAGNQFFSISEVRVGGISGVAAQFEVPDKNTISFVVPSFSSLTGSGDRSNWVNYCHPNPILVFSEARNVSGYASGAHGEEKNFTPIPQINGFFPASGLSGDSVTVQGDAFFGLTGLSITNISGSPSGYTHLTGLSNVVTGVGFPGGTGSGFADEVYLDFTITNNTGLSFNLPSGNFDGNIKVYGSGSVSAISDNHVEPHLEITGFYPPVGITGSYALISGQYFLDEIINNTSGIFSGLTGNTFEATGVLVAFNGDHASGCFTKINNNLISGLVPVSAKSGPVRIAKNINVLLNSGEIPYYQSSGTYHLEVPAPEVSGLASVGGEESFFGFYSILETGSYNSGIAGNSGISLTGTSVANWKTGTALFTPPVVGVGIYDQSISGAGGAIDGPNMGSQVTFIEENFIPMSDGSSPKSSLLTFKGNNFFETGHTGIEVSPPIIAFIPQLGPEIDECLEHFNAGSGFLSGCEAAYLVHYSGNHEHLDIDSPNFQPGLLQCFLTDQASERASVGMTGSVTGGSETVTNEVMGMLEGWADGHPSIGPTGTYLFLPSGEGAVWGTGISNERVNYWSGQSGSPITVSYYNKPEFGGGRVTVETTVGETIAAPGAFPGDPFKGSGFLVDLFASGINNGPPPHYFESGYGSGTPLLNTALQIETGYQSGTTYFFRPTSCVCDAGSWSLPSFFQHREGMEVTVTYYLTGTVSCSDEQTGQFTVGAAGSGLIGGGTGLGFYMDLGRSDVNRYPVNVGWPHTCQFVLAFNSGGFFNGWDQASCIFVSAAGGGGGVDGDTPITVFQPTGSSGILVQTAAGGGGGEATSGVSDESMAVWGNDTYVYTDDAGIKSFLFQPLSEARQTYWEGQEGRSITVSYNDADCDRQTVETTVGVKDCDAAILGYCGIRVNLGGGDLNRYPYNTPGTGTEYFGCYFSGVITDEIFSLDSATPAISGSYYLLPDLSRVAFWHSNVGMPVTVTIQLADCSTVDIDTVVGASEGGSSGGNRFNLGMVNINMYPEPGFPNTCQNVTVSSAGTPHGLGVSGGEPYYGANIKVSQAAFTGTEEFTTIDTSPPLTGTNGLNESSETLGSVVNESTPPNFDPLSTSLGSTTGNNSPSAGSGPSVVNTFPPKATSRLTPNSLQTNIYGQCAFITHLGGTGSISYPPAEGPMYTPKSKIDPASINIYQNPNKNAYSNFPRIQYGVPAVGSSNPETNNWTTVVTFNNGRQLTNLAGVLTPEQISNFQENRNQIPGYNKIIYTNNPNTKGNQNTNLRTQTRGTNLIGGTTGPISRTLNQDINKGKSLGSLRRGTLRFSTVPSSAYTGRPGHYKLSFNREALSPIPSSSIYGTQEASELAGYKKGIIGFMPGIEGLVKMGNKTSSFGGGSANGEIRSQWARQPIGGGATPGNTVVDPPIQMIVSEDVPPNFDNYASSLGQTGLQIPTSQTTPKMAGSPAIGGQQGVTSSPYLPGPTVHLGPFNAPQGVARTVTQNFPSTVPPHLYPPLGGPCGILPNPPITLYPKITPTRTEDMTNICASPCTAAHTGNTGWGIGVLADPEISGCAVNNCFQHCLKTGSSGYSYYEPVAQSMFAIKSSQNVPYQTSEIKRTGITYCSVAAADEPVIESTGVGRFGGGYLTTEASTELDLSAEDKWTVQFWAKFEDQHRNVQREPYSGIDVALFGFSGENAAESGNTFFNVGFSREVIDHSGVIITGDTDFDNVRLLLSITGDKFDKSSRNLTGVNGGATNTSITKFSTTPSYTFDGNDYILIQGVENGNASVTYPSIWDFNRENTDLTSAVPTQPLTQTSELTVEFWIKMPPLASTSHGHDVAIINGSDFAVIYDDGYGLGGYVRNGDRSFSSYGNGVGIFNNPNGNGSARIDDDNWHHVAFCKSGNNLKLFVNGLKSGNMTAKGWNGLISNYGGSRDEVYVGKDVPQWRGQGRYAAGALSGTIQELRISDIARYGADFSVPTEPYPTGTLNSMAYSIVNTVKPYVDLSGVQSSTNYYTGWFSDTGWHHFAFVKNGTGYSTYYDGDSVGLNVAAADYDCFMPSGHTKFYFGGLPTGRFGKFNTGFNQQFTSGSDTDLLLHFNNNLLDSGRYNQTITSGGFPFFSSGNDGDGADQKFGDYALAFTGTDYLQTSGKHFTYGTGDFTVECWLKPDGALLGDSETGNAIQTVWALANQFGEFSTGNGLALMLNHSTSNLRLAFDSEIQQLQVDLVPPLFGNYLESGKWNHVAVTRENNMFYGFVNGDPAGAFGGQDFAEHQSTKQFFTGTPTLDLTGQSLFIGGAVSGDLSMAFAPTGELYNTQPYRLQRDAESEHYSIEAGTDSCAFRRSIGKDSTLLNTGVGYSYRARTSGIIEITVETLSRWGGARMTSLGVPHSYAGVRFEHNGTAINADGTRSLVGVGENTIRWEIGGWEATRQSSNQSFIFGDLTDCEWAADGANDYIGPFVPSCDEPKSISMRGCEVKKVVNQIITGVNVGDEITLIANRYFNEGGPGIQVVTSNGTTIDNDLDDLYRRNTMGATEDPLASGPDILHIESMLIRENILCNYMGQIDEFRISSGVKYSNIPDTGSYASGFLNTDLGGLVYIDELNIKKDSLYGNLDANNGIEAVPVAAPATGYNFEVVLSSGDLITNGTVGDNEAQPLRTFLTDVSTSGGAMLTGSENGNAKFGNHSMIFPTGNTTSGAQNFLYKSGISFGTGDFLAEMWIKPSGFTYDTRVGIPGALYAINNTTNFYPQYYGDDDLYNEEGRIAFSQKGWGGINGAFNFGSSGLATGDISYMRVSGNQISGGLLPSLQWPETNPIISVPSGNFGDFSTNDFTIEFLFMSEDRVNLSEKVFTWGPDCSCGDGPCLSWVINDGELNNNNVFWNGCGVGESSSSSTMNPAESVAAFTSIANCKLLLHSDTTNGSTTFTDSAGNFSLSAGGDAKHSTAQKKFGASSILFDGDTDQVITSTTSDTTLGGEAAHTFECWFNTNSTDLQYLVSRNSNQQYAGLSINPGSSSYNITWGGNAGGTDLNATCTISTGVWHHVAVVVDGNGNASIYFDGNEVASTNSWEHWNTYGGNFATPSDNITIGAQHYTSSSWRYTFDGYIDEVRWSDVARYSTSTAGNSNINFGFDLCDGKYHVCTLTRLGDIFAVYIDGTIINVADGLNTDPLDLGNSPLDIGLPYDGSSPTMNIAKFRVWKGVSVPNVKVMYAGGTPHYEISNSPRSIYEVMPDGIDGQAYFAGPQWSNGLIPNRNSSHEASPINNSLLKILDLEPEASIIPIGATAGVAEAQISQFKDSSSSNITLKNRGVHRYVGDSDNIKFGNSSMLFKINGAAGSVWNQPGIKIREGTFDFGTSSDFTIECWVKGDNYEDFSLLSSAVTSQIIGSSKNWGAHMRGKKLQWYDGTNGFVPTSRTEASNMENSWVHVAIVRNGGNLSSYVDGVKIDHGANSFDVNDALNGTVIGPFYTDSNRVGVDENGLWVDQIRVSDNARYTAAFTPPSAAFTNDGNTKLLIDSDTMLSPSESQRVFDRSMIPSPSGITNAATVTIQNSSLAKAPGSYANRQSLLSIGGYDRGFNFFLSGQTGTNDFNYLGLDLSNGPTLTGTEAQRIGDRYELFDKQGSSQYWVSGEWNHIALARINNNFQAYVNGNSAGKLNLFNTYYPSGQTDAVGRNIGLTQVLTGTTADANYGGGTFQWEGYEYDLTPTAYSHSQNLSPDIANPRIQAELGDGWHLVDWNDFKNFTEEAFLGLARELGPKVKAAPRTCEEAIAITEAPDAGPYSYPQFDPPGRFTYEYGTHEWRWGWLTAGGRGTNGHGGSYFFSWLNHVAPFWYPPTNSIQDQYRGAGFYLDKMVALGSWTTFTLQYLARRQTVVFKRTPAKGSNWGGTNSRGGCGPAMNLYASGGVTTTECVDITHFGDSSENYYVTGLYTGSGINLTTGRLVGEDPLATGGHYVSGLDVYGRLALGGGAQTSYNFQGQIDAFSFKTGNFDDFTGLKMQRPEATIGCDSLNELVCHFDRESGSIDFDDEHCCHTGRQAYDEAGVEYKPAYWGEIVGIKGSGFFNVSGVFFGKNRQPSLDYFVPERNYISAVVPDGALSGPTTVVGSGLGADAGFEITGCDLTISPPPITIYDSNFPISGSPNQVVTVSGRGLNQITRISLFNSLNEALYLDVTGTNIGTGINFAIPETHKISGEGPDLDYDLLPLVSNIRFSGTTGFYNNSEQIHSFTTGEVFLLNSGIKIISPSSGIYNEQISLSGRFFTGDGRIDTPIFPLFQTGTDVGDQTYSQIYYTHGINTQYIKAVDGQLKGAITGMTTQVPRDIVRGQMGISGSGTDISVISTGIFTPIPTISGIEIKNLKVGSAFRITGLNACYIRPVVGFTGINLQPAYNFSGTSSAGALSLIANTGNAEAYESGTYYRDGNAADLLEYNTFGDGLSGYNDLYYFGNIFIDKSQLTGNWPESAQTGFVIITGTLNATTIGTGNPFLISKDELRDASGDYNIDTIIDNASEYKENILRNTGEFVYAMQNINKVTGDQIIISGRVPELSGLKPVMGTTGTLIQISGTNLLNITGIYFSGSSQYCEIGTGEFDRNDLLTTGYDPLTNELVVSTAGTGYYLSNSYQGTGEYIDRGDWLNVFYIRPNECANLKNVGPTTVDVLYDTGVSTTGDIA